jgi:hypothetical protein
MNAGMADSAVLEQAYHRYKRVALATGAALLLDEDLVALDEAADALVRDSRAALAAADPALAAQFAACVHAAEEVQDLLVHAARDRGSVGTADIERVRASHSELRREVWKVIPCEYVPCSAAHERDRLVKR